jgi:capsular polysaccharide biosynthesis protein
LRDSFLPHVQPTRPSTSKRLYVSRARCGRRHLQNEAECQPILERYGFETVYPEELTFVEQISLFHQAEAILGPHGAAFANLAFCKKGTKVVEIFNEGWRPEIFWQLSETMELDHYCLFGKTPPGAAGASATLQSKNVLLPPEDLAAMLKKAGL